MQSWCKKDFFTQNLIFKRWKAVLILEADGRDGFSLAVLDCWDCFWTLYVCEFYCSRKPSWQQILLVTEMWRMLSLGAEGIHLLWGLCWDAHHSEGAIKTFLVLSVRSLSSLGLGWTPSLMNTQIKPITKKENLWNQNLLHYKNSAAYGVNWSPTIPLTLLFRKEINLTAR